MAGFLESGEACGEGDEGKAKRERGCESFEDAAASLVQWSQWVWRDQTKEGKVQG